MPDRLRILATGSLNTGDHKLRFVPASATAFHAELPLAEVLSAALAHGAVLYEIDASYDPYQEYHAEDDIILVFGTPMTYKAYWEMFPDEKSERPAPDWQLRILLQVCAPLLRLHTPTTIHLLRAETGAELDSSVKGADMALFIALMPAESPAILEQEDEIPFSTPAIQPGFIRPRLAAELEALNGHVWEWQLGHELTLQGSPFPATSQRDWGWAWARTYGPVYLNLFVAKTANELSDWLAQVPCSTYWEINDILVPSERRISFADVYVRVNPHEFHLQHDQYSREIIAVYNGKLSFIRNFHTPTPAQYSIDASLLAAILAGELGDVSWDLLDGDYVYFQATGTGLGSLRRYLDPSASEQEQRDHWSAALTRHQVDASAAESWEQIAVAITQHFHVPGTAGHMAANLDIWLAHTPITALPRAIEVSVKQAVYEEHKERVYGLLSVNNRILWSWSLRL
jgi:hypothetical protein